MEYSNTNAPEENSFRLSWLAYIRPVVFYLICVAVCVAVIVAQDHATPQTRELISHPVFQVTPYAIIAILGVLLLMRIYYLKTFRLFFNENGVYCFSGIFPWTKGVRGTAWQDISDANYFTGFVSWATKSYRIQIGHRYTKTSEMTVSNVRHGHLAVIKINEALNRKRPAYQV